MKFAAHVLALVPVVSTVAVQHAHGEPGLEDHLGGSLAGVAGGHEHRVAQRPSVCRQTLDAVSFDASSERARATARFVRRGDRLVEMLVIGDAKAFTTDTGREAIETFFTSMRID